VSLVEEEIAVVKGSFTLDDGGDITAGRFWARSPVGDGTYLELGEVLEGEFRVVEAKARTATCFFRVAIGTVTGDGTVSQSGRSITGHYETNFETSGTFDALRYPAGNDSWVCHHGFSGVGDGCDCGCGEVDSDCRTGCDEPGCAGGDCLFCYDGDGVASVCPD